MHDLAGGRVIGWSDNPNDWDQQVEEYFKARGFQDILVTGSGRRQADMYAGNPETKSFAVVEGKREENCKSGEAHECPYDERDYYLGDRPRREMWGILRPLLPATLRPKQTIVHVFAVTIWHQLFCYFWDVLEGQCPSAKVRKRKWTCTWPPTFQLTEPYLVVPLQYFDALDWVMRESHAQGWLPRIEAVAQDSQLGVAVARILYPIHKPRDLTKAR